MSLLQNIITQVAQNALTGGQSQQNSGLGGMLGQVVASQLGGGQSQAQGGLGGVLGSLLGGGQTRQNVPASDLGSVLGQVLGSQSAQQKGGFNKNTLLLALIPIVLGYIQKNGGLSGVLAKFQGNGLGNKAQSWVNIDTDNDGLDAQDVMSLFGKDEINRACQQTGASETEVCQGIAELLPQVVNDLTPNGDLATENEANAEISQILQQVNTNR
ncbi:YidB family protein [Moraxella bovis]|uniref:YidB family protein n=1 Tax=Moraxella bovis TaxID=476 RepID=UPI0009922844|nr:YidB family protein [Moraxella bovis]AWY20988.1 DUF937 domain-containing protein [Moraxella bovis]OOR90322.1 hypothetical protein B0182_05415 [Moraxella bovis]UZA17268.1 YidB family protein [Moraxella bovis]